MPFTSEFLFSTHCFSSLPLFCRTLLRFFSPDSIGYFCLFTYSIQERKTAVNQTANSSWQGIGKLLVKQRDFHFSLIISVSFRVVSPQHLQSSLYNSDKFQLKVNFTQHLDMKLGSCYRSTRRSFSFVAMVAAAMMMILVENNQVFPKFIAIN